MLTFDNKTNIHIDDIHIGRLDPAETIFFDIETTGFSATTCSLYLIGCMYLRDDEYYVKQFFLDESEDEAKLITDFFMFISNYSNIVHFNGEGFDIPFILEKCKKYKLPYNFDSLNSIDIYKDTSELRNLLKLENHKQKTLEKFLDLARDDRYSGGELINVYHDYLQSKSKNSLALLLLHNLEDVKGMHTLMSLYAYKAITDGDFLVKSLAINNYTGTDGQPSKEAIIELEIDDKVPKRISSGYKQFYFTAFGHTIKIKATIYTEELKFFYPNYKDYFYLPVEDTAIHKSVAFYVDKNFRTQAKAATCYSKKTGRFLPQYDEIISPYFKIDYNDKISYFELTDDFIADKSSIKSYCLHIITLLCKKLPV